MRAIDLAGEAEARGWDSARLRGVQPSSHEAGAMVLACAKLTKRAACRRASENMVNDEIAPSTKLSTLVTTCRDSYCPDLPAPRPALCDRADAGGLGPAVTKQMWAELGDAIVRHDLGASAEAVLDAKKRARVAATSALEAYLEAGSPPYETGSPDVTTRAVVPTDRPIVVVLHADGSASVEGRKLARDEAVDAVFVRLASERPRNTKVLIRAEPSVAYGRVVAMMDRAIRAELAPEIR